MKELSFCFLVAVVSKQGGYEDIRHIRFYLTTSRARPRLVVTFLRPNTNASCQHWDCSPLHAHAPSPAAAFLNLGERLSANPIPEDQLWSGQTSKLCHPVGCDHLFDNVWTQIRGPLFLVCPSFGTLPQLWGTISSSHIYIFCHSSKLYVKLPFFKITVGFLFLNGTQTEFPIKPNSKQQQNENQPTVILDLDLDV